MFRLLSPRRRDESGAVAILVALMALVLCMFAAYAIDIGLQVNRKHQLNDTLDAAAQAGAYALPGSAVTAKNEALAFAAAHDPTETGTLAPNVDFWCITASTGNNAPYAVDTTQIPQTCNPGTSPYTVNASYKSTGRNITCSEILCAIPCVEPAVNTATPKIACNTIRVFQGRDVPFSFAPAGGISQGTTGNIISVACKGSCGTINPNPLDVAVVADRTSSMGDADVAKLVTGIKGMLQQMTPSQQYVSLGSIGRSAQTTTASAASKACNSSARGLTYGSTSGSTGLWMPIAFSNDYTDASQALKTSSTLVKGVECLDNQSDIYQGTSLAAPMKAAARYLLGYTANNLSSLPARSAPPQKVLIFETDGQPNERQPTSGSASLSTTADIFSNPMDTDGGVITKQGDTAGTPTTVRNGNKSTITTLVTHNQTKTYTYDGGAQACQNLIDVAANAKAAGILVIMIGYNMSSKQCYDYDGVEDDYSTDKVSYTGTPTTAAGPEGQTSTTSGNNTYITKYQTTTTPKWKRMAVSTPVLSVMAQAASPVKNVDETFTQTSAQSDCSDANERAAENSDGDYLFCAASGTDMAPIFRTALSQATKGIKLLKLP